MALSTFRIGAMAGAAFAALCASGFPAGAVETGMSIYLKGATAFMSGILPPEPGAYVTSTYYLPMLKCATAGSSSA